MHLQSLSPPVPGVIYTPLIPTCPRVFVCSTFAITFMARGAAFRRTWRSFIPVSIPKVRYRRSLYLPHRKRMRMTVCRLSSHSQRGLRNFNPSLLKRKLFESNLLGLQLTVQEMTTVHVTSFRANDSIGPTSTRRVESAFQPISSMIPSTSQTSQQLNKSHTTLSGIPKELKFPRHESYHGSPTNTARLTTPPF